MKKTHKLLKLTTLVLILGAVMYACQDPGSDLAKPSNQLSVRNPVDVNPGATGPCDVFNITTNTTWGSNDLVRLYGDVRVNSGAVLTIQPGCVILGDKATRASLSIERGSKIIANGTESAPIVFTSSADPGDRRPMDWGGLMIFGNAPNNLGTNLTPEGFEDCALSDPPLHGGNNCEDNSGVLKFVRIEYAGIPAASVANSEKNALTLYSVGSGTEIHHVQVSYGGDDGIEWFGGCVNASYLWSLGMQDDDFDTDNGFSGCVQYGVAMRHPDHLDNSGSNGFESDNNASGTTVPFQTEAKFSNFTLIGPYDTDQARTVPNDVNPTSTTPRFLDGLHLRRNTDIDVYNSIVVGWRTNQGFAGGNADCGITTSALTLVAPDDDHVGTPNSNIYAETACLEYSANGGAKATVPGDEFTPGSLAELSGLTSLAWPAVTVVSGTYTEFVPFTPDVIMPYGLNFTGLTSPVLETGSDASAISGCFSVNDTEPGASTYFRGAIREYRFDVAGSTRDNGWFIDSEWLEMDPQNEDYEN